MDNGIINIMQSCKLAEVQTSISFTQSRQLMQPALNGNNGFVFAIFENDNITSMSGCLNPLVSNIFHYMHHQQIKEGFYLTAIDNLIKKNDYLQLTIQLDQDLISEQEFEVELDENENHYLIKMNNDFQQDHFHYISEILPKLNRSFSSDEVSEMFSAPIEMVNLYLDSFTEESK